MYDSSCRTKTYKIKHKTQQQQQKYCIEFILEMNKNHSEILIAHIIAKESFQLVISRILCAYCKRNRKRNRKEEREKKHYKTQCNAMRCIVYAAIKRDQGHKLEMNINLNAIDRLMHQEKKRKRDREKTLGGK